MNWILVMGSIVSAWVILSILANERQAQLIRIDQESRQAAAIAAKKAAEIPVLHEVGSSR